MTSAVDGLVVVDKPAGWTSHDVVARIRRLAGTRRVGHAGTLDPMATGVLVVGIGKATRLLGHLAAHDKDYDATIRLGVTTTSDDADGDVLTTTDAGAVNEAALRAAMVALTGDLEQVPSAVSAVKVDGVRAYAKVRAGETVDLKPRSVHVARFELRDRRGDDLDVGVTCSTGTYVRALARDLGAALGVGAHLTALRRTRVGGIGLDRARTLEQLEELSADGSFSSAIIPLAEAVATAFPRWDVSADDARRIGLGQRLPPVGLPAGLVGAFAPDGVLVALVEERNDAVRPTVVFTPGEASR
ncbi:MAG TPA: tRNA pseudouridine(55) synthase TruB [Mycobacteriales bacterium]|jgi:tRNA pseudouridine55 synthase|nr:tRNA pseudouridine(55) synthase TruB [Mycobacteriales bacterium]